MFSITLRPVPGTPQTFNTETSTTVGECLARCNVDNPTDLSKWTVKANGELLSADDLSNAVSSDTTYTFIPRKIKGNK